MTGLLEMLLISMNIQPSMIGLTSSATMKTMMTNGGNGGSIQRCMRHFMGLFFVTFSMFKFINLSQFVDVFAKYDLMTQRWLVNEFHPTSLCLQSITSSTLFYNHHITFPSPLY